MKMGGVIAIIVCIFAVALVGFGLGRKYSQMKDPTSIYVYAYKIFVSIQKKEFDDAVNYYNRVKTMKNKDLISNLEQYISDAHFNRGQERLNDKNFMGAIADFNRVIELNPKLAEAYAGLFDAHIEQKALDRAEVDYERVKNLDKILAEAIKPKLATAYRNHGCELEKENKIKESLEVFIKAIDFGGTNVCDSDDAVGDTASSYDTTYQMDTLQRRYGAKSGQSANNAEKDVESQLQNKED